VPEVVPEQLVSTCSLPKECRNHVYIFLLQGCDPLDWANLSGVVDHIHELGFIKIYCGAWYYGWHFEDEIRRIHREDPTARFVILGFYAGANAARDLADAVKPDHIPIDLLVYLGGVVLHESPNPHPENALKVLHIRGQDYLLNGKELDHVVNVRYPEVFNCGIPSDKRTLQLLAHELTVAAARVPYVEKVRPPLLEEQAPTPRPLPPPEEEAPKPRPVPPPAPLARDKPRDEWDFLMPAPVPPPTAAVLTNGARRPSKPATPASDSKQPTAGAPQRNTSQ
jgi:hypothetical protein